MFIENSAAPACSFFLSAQRVQMQKNVMFISQTTCTQLFSLAQLQFPKSIMIFFSSASIFVYLILAQMAVAFHDSLGFLVAPRARACFFEDFRSADSTSPETRIVDVFVQSGGKANLKLQVGIDMVMFALQNWELKFLSRFVQIFGPLSSSEVDEVWLQHPVKVYSPIDCLMPMALLFRRRACATGAVRWFLSDRGAGDRQPDHGPR
jgi:hypothetical protein